MGDYREPLPKASGRATARHSHTRSIEGLVSGVNGGIL